MSFLLTLILFLPLIGGIAVLFLRQHPERCRWVSFGVTVADLILVLAVWIGSDPIAGTMDGRRLMVDLPWIPALGIRYFLLLDGISLVMILLTAFLMVLCILISWRSVTDRAGIYYFVLLASETAVLGVFLAADLFLFYLFWELQLIPIFFLIGLWGHPDRVRAAVKFFLFSMAGGLFLLIAIIGLYVIHGAQTEVYGFTRYQLMNTTLGPTLEWWLFGAFLAGFAVKIPIVPIHTWLPDAHTEAPTAGSVILAGLLLKTGAYGLLRFGFPLFPTAAARSAPILLALGLLGLFYIAWIALSQQDIKRIVAYSSISHMGLIVVGLAVWNEIALSGAVIQMVNHGITTSALFILVGILEERGHSRQLGDYHGLWHRMPVFSGFFLFFAMAAVGLPGLNNFIGEILILMGAFQEWPAAGIIGFIGIVLTLIYILRLVQNLLFGPVDDRMPGNDITHREAAVLIPLALAVLWIGLHPGPLLDLLNPSVDHLVDLLGGNGGTVDYMASGAN
ncbi:MAG: complex I subunit 4 family protein [Thermodesulfobacteriota bacterium]